MTTEGSHSPYRCGSRFGAGRIKNMVTTCLKPFLHSTIVLTTVVLLTPTTIAFGPHPGPQASGAMLPRAQFVSMILEDHLATLIFERGVSDYVTTHRLLEGPLPTLEVSTDMR